MMELVALTVMALLAIPARILAQDTSHCPGNPEEIEITYKNSYLQQYNVSTATDPTVHNCSWIFRRPPDTEDMILFLDMGSLQNYNCDLSYIMVYEGNNRSAPQLQKFCNGSGSSNTNIYVRTGAIFVEVYINMADAGVSQVDVSFEVHWQEIPCKENSWLDVTTYWNSITFAVPCVTWDTKCVWALSRNSSSDLAFMSVEYSNCFNTYGMKFIVKDGDSNSPEINGTCDGKGMHYRTTGHDMYMEFTASAYASCNFRFHLIDYKTEILPCNGTKTIRLNEQSEIYDINVIDKVRGPNNCAWIIDAGDSMVQLRVNISSYYGSRPCDRMQLKIYDGQNETTPLIYKFCTDPKSATMASTGHFLYLEYSSRGEWTGFQFKATANLLPQKYNIALITGLSVAAGLVIIVTIVVIYIKYIRKAPSRRNSFQLTKNDSR